MDTPIPSSNIGKQAVEQQLNEPVFNVMPQPGKPYAPPPVSKPIGPESPPPPPPPPPGGLARMTSPQELPEPPSSSSSWKWLYYVLGLIILLGLGAGAYYMLGVKKAPETPAPQTSNTRLPKVWLAQYFNSETCNAQNICGDEADPDNDGLSNYNEFKDNTVPTSSDTDSDGLADGDEVNVYKTDPTLQYTDRRLMVAENDWTDSFQIKNDYDPLTPGLKFTDLRKQQIANDTARFRLHAPTTNSLAP